MENCGVVLVDISVGVSEHHKLAVQSLLPSPWLKVSPQNLKSSPEQGENMRLDGLKKANTGWAP